MKKKANEEKAPKRAKQEAKAEATQEVAQENKTKENNKAKESKIKENKTKGSKIKETAKEPVPVKKLSFNEALEELFANSLSDCVSYESIIQISAKVPT
ncbi:RNA polymerase sigma factor RpoD, partial [Helicobacter pylori]